MHLVQCPAGYCFTIFTFIKSCPLHLGLLIKIKYGQLCPRRFLNDASILLAPTRAIAFSPPPDPRAHEQQQQRPVPCRDPSEVALGSPRSGYGLQDLTPGSRQKQAGQQGFFAAVFGLAAFFFSSVSLSGSEDLLPSSLDGVFWGWRVQLRCAAAAAVCWGPAWGEQRFGIPADPRWNSTSPAWPYKSAPLSFVFKATN